MKTLIINIPDKDLKFLMTLFKKLGYKAKIVADVKPIKKLRAKI